jgi:hypothetical protein
MTLDKKDIKTEPLASQNTFILDLIKQVGETWNPNRRKPWLETVLVKVKTDANLTAAELYNKLQIILIEKSECSCQNNRDVDVCKCGAIENKFILGQFYFDHVSWILDGT